MDFQEIVNTCGMAAAVLSVEKTDDGHHGEIRIICSNALYKQKMGDRYRDNMLYSDLVPKDLKFEEYCYRAAALKQHLHAYVEVKGLGFWLDGNYIPLSAEFDDEKLTTLNSFFENNLHVSETARQLFVHRNTLVYRLEKLQKSTGLDIRNFEDALTFKIALMVVSYMKYMGNEAS